MIQQLQIQPDETESIAARQLPAWSLSLALHVALLIVVSLMSFATPLPFDLILTVHDAEPLEEIPQEFHFSDEIMPTIGALSAHGDAAAMAAAPTISDLDEVSDVFEEVELGEIQASTEEMLTTTLDPSNKVVSGVAGVGVTGAGGAIDRITHEILLSMEDRDTLVVWLFDQSGSLSRQRKEIREKLRRIYEELGLLSGTIPERSDQQQPLLTSVMAFGKSAKWMIDAPTADVDQIQDAIKSITMDDSGIENVFSSVYMAAEKFKRWKRKRNVMLIVVSDEVGDGPEQHAGTYGLNLSKEHDARLCNGRTGGIWPS